MNSSSIEDWLNDLGNKTPAPGGGAVAGLNAAISAATLKMVCEYSKGEGIDSHIESLSRLISSGLAEAQNDAEAYSKLRDAYKQKNSIQDALKGALEPSIQTVKIVDEIIEITQDIFDKSNPNLVSDIAVSSSNAKSALEGSIVNLEINLKDITDTDLVSDVANYIDQAQNLIKTAGFIIETARNKIKGEEQ